MTVLVHATGVPFSQPKRKRRRFHLASSWLSQRSVGPSGCVVHSASYTDLKAHLETLGGSAVFAFRIEPDIAKRTSQLKVLHRFRSHPVLEYQVRVSLTISAQASQDPSSLEFASCTLTVEDGSSLDSLAASSLPSVAAALESASRDPAFLGDVNNLENLGTRASSLPTSYLVDIIPDGLCFYVHDGEV